ncbi:protein of unknown function [Burkholderia multivorans]
MPTRAGRRPTGRLSVSSGIAARRVSDALPVAAVQFDAHGYASGPNPSGLQILVFICRITNQLME